MPFVRVLSVVVAALIVAPSIARADTTTMGTLIYSFTYTLNLVSDTMAKT